MKIASIHAFPLRRKAPRRLGRAASGLAGRSGDR
jgi:hypothetical protein